VLGGRILVDTLEDVNKVFRAARDQDIKMIEVENYFISTKDSGYRAIHFNFVTKDGFSMEVQIQHKDLAAAFKQGKAYRKYKDKSTLTKEEEADRAALAAQDKILFDQTFAQIKQREGVLDDIDNVEVVVGEIADGNEITNVTRTLKEFKDDIANDELIIGELVKRECV
jgi:ppGpp synthetase/RelA/SpoT-type nucleotidyltranferase